VLNTNSSRLAHCHRTLLATGEENPEPSQQRQTTTKKRRRATAPAELLGLGHDGADPLLDLLQIAKVVPGKRSDGIRVGDRLEVLILFRVRKPVEATIKGEGEVR